jgi:hypothetical protein
LFARNEVLDRYNSHVDSFIAKAVQLEKIVKKTGTTVIPKMCMVTNIDIDLVW